MASVKLTGNISLASRWLPWAHDKLRNLRQATKLRNVYTNSEYFQPARGVTVMLSIVSGMESILINAMAGAGAFVVCHVGDSTSGADYIKKYYDVDTWQEIAKPFDWQLIDDGKYGVNFDLIGTVEYQSDPDDYVYYLNGGGIGVASSVLGIDAKNTSTGTSRRFIINESAEREAWDAMVDFGAIQYLVPSFRLTARQYQISPLQPFVCRYTADGILTINDTVRTSLASVIALNKKEFLSYTDKLMFSAKAFLHYLNTSIPKKSVALTGTTDDEGHAGAALAASVQYYSDGRVAQDILRAAQYTIPAGPDTDEPITKSTVNPVAGTSVDSTVYHRGAGDNRDKWYQDASANSDRTVDGDMLVTNFGFSAVKNDVTLPYGVREDGAITGVRVEKTTDGSSVKTSLVVAGDTVDTNGYEDTIWFHPDDVATIPKTVGDLGRAPIVAFRTHFNILHVHHGAKFDAVVYIKTTYVSSSERFTEHYTGWLGSPLYVDPTARIRETLVLSRNRYRACVNGVVYDLGHAFYQVERKLTVAPVTPVGGDVAVNTVYLEGVSDAGYNELGMALSDQEQVSRIFTSENDRLLLAFDAFPISWQHELVVSGTTLTYNVIPASAPTIPPTVDGGYTTPNQRRVILFSSDGEIAQDVDFPEKSEGVMWNRLNGISLMEA